MQRRWAVILCFLLSAMLIASLPVSAQESAPPRGRATVPAASRPLGRVRRVSEIAPVNYQAETSTTTQDDEPSDPLEYLRQRENTSFPEPPPDTINPQPVTVWEPPTTAQAPLPAPDFSNTCDPFITGACAPGGCDESGCLATGQCPNWIYPFFNLGVKAGDRVIGDGRLFVPLFQNDYSLFFGDVRYQYDNRGAVEGNFGLGYREIFDDYWIAGLYAYYDHLKSQHNHTFDQATVGAELLSVDWDFRVNGYFPELGGKFVNAQAAIANGNIVVNNFEERAYRGVDAEVGYRMFFWGVNDDFEVRLFGGGFYLNNGARGFDEIAGPKARLEFRAHDLNILGFQSRLEAGVETSWDQIRNEQVYGFARLRIPLYTGHREQLTPLRRRLADLPVRDADIVTHRAVGLQESAFNAQTGQALGQVHRIDADSNLLAVTAQSQERDVILLDGSYGDIAVPYATSLVMKDGQSFVGGGSHLLLAGEQSGRIVPFTLPGTSPTLIASQPPEFNELEMMPPLHAPAPLLTLASQSLVQGVTFAGGSVAIAGDQVSQSVIRDITIRDTTETGIELQHSGAVTISRADIHNPGTHGINVVQGAGMIVTQSAIEGSDSSAIRFDHVSTGAIAHTTISKVGAPSESFPDGTLAPAIELVDVKDIGIFNSRIAEAAQAINVNGLTGVLSMATNTFDLTDPVSMVPAGTPLTAIRIDGIGTDALISITSNSLTVNRLAGQTAISMDLNSSEPAPGPGLFQAIVQVANNQFLNMSGRGIELNSSLPATVAINSNTFDYPQIGLPGGLPTGSPGPFFVTSNDSILELELSENTVTAGVGTVAHQPMLSSIDAFNSDLTLKVFNNEIPIDALSIFRDAASTFDIDENSGNDFPLQLAPGSQPIP